MPDQTTEEKILAAAARVIAPGLTEHSLADLRRQLETARFIGPPRLVGYSPPPAVPGESTGRTLDRLRFAVREIHLARVLGTDADARRVIERAVRDVRTAAGERLTTSEGNRKTT